MNKFVFVVSHLGSSSGEFVNILNSHPNIEIQNTGFIYTSPLSLEPVLKLPHKLLNSGAIYGDHLLKNFNLQTKNLYPICKFIYYISPAKPSINSICSTVGINFDGAFRYYCYRLRRIYEMIKDCPGVFITDQIAEKSLENVQSYLDLIEPFHYEWPPKQSLLNLIEPFRYEWPPKQSLDAVPYDIISKAEERYEYYLYKIKKYYPLSV